MLKMSLELTIHTPGSSGFWCLALDMTKSIASQSNRLTALKVNQIAPFWLRGINVYIYLTKKKNWVR